MTEGLLEKRGVTFFSGELQFYKKIKSYLKYLMTKKFVNKNIFICHKAMNSNWEILTKNLVTFKR